MRNVTYDPAEVMMYAVETARGVEMRAHEIERKVVEAEIMIRHYETMLYNETNRKHFRDWCSKLMDARREAWEAGVDVLEVA